MSTRCQSHPRSFRRPFLFLLLVLAGCGGELPQEGEVATTESALCFTGFMDTQNTGGTLVYYGEPIAVGEYNLQAPNDHCKPTGYRCIGADGQPDKNQCCNKTTLTVRGYLGPYDQEMVSGVTCEISEYGDPRCTFF